MSNRKHPPARRCQEFLRQKCHGDELPTAKLARQEAAPLRRMVAQGLLPSSCAALPAIEPPISKCSVWISLGNVVAMVEVAMRFAYINGSWMLLKHIFLDIWLRYAKLRMAIQLNGFRWDGEGGVNECYPLLIQPGNRTCGMWNRPSSAMRKWMKMVYTVICIYVHRTCAWINKRGTHTQYITCRERERDTNSVHTCVFPLPYVGFSKATTQCLMDL